MTPELTWRVKDASNFESDQLTLLDQALRNNGFLKLRVPDFDWAKASQAFLASRRFFAKPLSHKRQFGYQSAATNFGYQGLFEEALDPASGFADQKEAFTMRNALTHQADKHVWPNSDFQSSMSAFYGACFDLSKSLMAGIAVIAGLPKDYFSERHSGENVTLRLLRYPALAIDGFSHDPVVAGKHSDYGLLTLLFQDEQPGLEVLGPEGDWQLLSSEAEEVVVNVGDLMQRWTNDAYPSTLHRVRQMDPGRDRYSIAFFADPDASTVVDVLPNFMSTDNPARYQPITAGAHIQGKLEASHRP